MKKTLLITVDFSPNVGGVATYLSKLCERLPEDRIFVLAPTQKDSSEFDNVQKYKIFRRKLLSTSPLIWPKWIFLIKTAREIVKKERIEQIIVGQILPIGTVALIAKIIFKIPYVLSTHAMDITILKRSNWKTWLAKKIVKQASWVTTVSEFTKQKLLELGADPNHISIISPATDITQINQNNVVERLKREYGLYNKNILLTIGRLVHRKGHIHVLKSLKTVLKQLPNTVYIIGSDGPCRNELESFIKQNNLVKNVILVGTIPNDKLASYYRLADIFVMPTTEPENGDLEGFGIVYLEANAFGRPVIASRIGGVEDSVVHEQTGLLINSDNVTELSEAIIRLLTDKKLAERLGNNGYQRVISSFNWESRAKEFDTILS